MSSSINVEETLTRIRSNYISRLQTEFPYIEELSKEIHQYGYNKDKIAELKSHLHSMSGSGGTFGLPELSTKARVIELRLQKWLDSEFAVVTKNQLYDVAVDISLLRDLVVLTSAPKETVIVNKFGPLGDKINVWLIDDVSFTPEFATELTKLGFVVTVFDSIAIAEESAKQQGPDLVIVGISVMLSITLRHLSCPIILISDEDNFKARLQAAQFGVTGFVCKPLHVQQLSEKIKHMLTFRSEPARRVLIIDDDVELAEHNKTVLTNANMIVEMIHVPTNMIDTITTFKPEIILMDLHLGDYSGIDLANIIRQYDQFSNIMVVFFSSEDDLGIQVDAMNRGLIDFINKNINSKQLIAAIDVRLKWSRHKTPLVHSETPKKSWFSYFKK